MTAQESAAHFLEQVRDRQINGGVSSPEWFDHVQEEPFGDESDWTIGGETIKGRSEWFDDSLGGSLENAGFGSDGTF